MASLIIPFPSELRPRLPTIMGNVDYQTLRLRLEQIDALLEESGVEKEFVERSLQRWLPPGEDKPSARQQQHYQLRSRRALRCTVLRTLIQENYRGFSCQLAGNPLYQWFCLTDALDVIRVPSKSELQRFTHWLPAPEMREVINSLLQSAMERPQALQLREALDVEEYFLDTTCVKANIHFPVDWVLLRDGVRTLMKATLLIRQEGLKGRMESPEVFLRRINRLSMEMTHQRRRPQSQRGRKRVLRQMKKVVKSVRAHAQRHRELLEENWPKTQWTRPQAEQVLSRIDRVLKLLPRAQKQAHERIIGQRMVPNKEKILSLYDTDVHVIVRGKAGADVEFGNTVLVGENRQAIILDYEVFQEQAPADAQLLKVSVQRVREALGRKVGAEVGDRGFYSQANQKALQESEIFDGVCPRDPQELKKRMKGKKFARLQRRRSQTEGRIGILKAGFWGRPMRAKGFENRQLAVAWGVLTHNLWMLARMRKTKRNKIAKPPRLKAA
jgi:Transposase DDE domain